MGAAREISRRWLYAVLVVASGLVITFFALTFYGGTGALVVAVSMLGCAAIAWASWALFIRDRSRGRRRCPKCWYDMSGTNGLRCPECGRTAKREKSLHRTHRHWRMAMLAILPALMAAFLAVQPKVQRDGWVSIVPTTALIWRLHLENNDWVITEITRRISEPHPLALGFDTYNHDVLFAWQWREIGRICSRQIQDEELATKRYALLDLMSHARHGGQDEASADAIREVIIGLLDDPDPQMRGYCAMLLVDRRDVPRSLDLLRPLLADEDKRVRDGAMLGLRFLVDSSDEAVSMAAECLSDPDPATRLSALSVMTRAAQFRHLRESAIALIYKLADDPDPQVREMVVERIAEFVLPEEARVFIVDALRSDDNARARGALWAIAYGGLPGRDELLPSVIGYLTDSDETVRNAAGAALESFGAEVLAPYEAEIESSLDPRARPETAEVITRVLRSLDGVNSSP